MYLFAKQIVIDLKPFQSLWLFSECKFSSLQGERFSQQPRRMFWKSFTKIFEKHLWRSWFWSCRLGFYIFIKNKFIHRFLCRSLVALSAGSFAKSHFQVWSFVKHLLWHQNYFGMDYPPIFRPSDGVKCDITWQAKTIISPLPQCLWPWNMVVWWLIFKGS